MDNNTNICMVTNTTDCRQSSVNHMPWYGGWFLTFFTFFTCLTLYWSHYGSRAIRLNSWQMQPLSAKPQLYMYSYRVDVNNNLPTHYLHNLSPTTYTTYQPTTYTTYHPLLTQLTNPLLTQLTNPLLTQLTNPLLTQLTNPLLTQLINPLLTQLTNPLLT